MWRSVTLDAAKLPRGCSKYSFVAAKLGLLARVGCAVESFNLRPGVPLGGTHLAAALGCLAPETAGKRGRAWRC